MCPSRSDRLRRAMATERKILIADDEPAERELTAAEFQRVGFRVLTTENGTETIALATAEKPDAVILDLLMPGFNGFEVLNRLRQVTELSTMVVIIRSGKSYKPDIDKALELGADAYVVKPGDLEELVKLTINHIEKRARKV